MNRITFVVPYRFLPPRNGGHQAAAGFATALSAQRPVVVISTPDNQPEGYSFSLETLLPKGVKRYISLPAALACYRFFKKNDIKYAVLFQPFIGLLLYPVCWMAGVKTAVYVQNIEYQRFRTMNKWWWPLVWFIEYLIYRLSWRLFFISPDDLVASRRLFGLPASRCALVPYGINQQEPPANKEMARREVINAHQLPTEARILLFFGPQQYQPNREAVHFIVDKLAPVLRAKLKEPYQILICGGGMSDDIQSQLDENTHYLGFVPDIDRYVKAADVVLNPIMSGGGVKTKIIEAIALGATVISTHVGAIGVDNRACGPKLQIVADADAEAFYKAIKAAIEQNALETPASFYEVYHWDRAIQAALNCLK